VAPCAPNWLRPDGGALAQRRTIHSQTHERPTRSTMRASAGYSEVAVFGCGSVGSALLLRMGQQGVRMTVVDTDWVGGTDGRVHLCFPEHCVAARAPPWHLQVHMIRMFTVQFSDQEVKDVT
jgi:hypothetical protein